MNSSNIKLTEGSVIKSLILFSVPFMLSTFLQATLNMVDMLIISKFCGIISVSGVGIGGQITFLVINGVVGLSVGASILVAQYYGAKRHQEIKSIINTLFTLYFILSAVFLVFFLFATDFILSLIQTPKEAFDEAKRYIITSMFGILFIFLYNGISAVMRGMGDSKRPLIFIAIACVVNVILDLITVTVFNWGAMGVALATVISQAISVVIALLYLKKHSDIINFSKLRLKIDRQMLKKILKLGIPTAIMHSIATFSFIALTSIVNVVGGAEAVYTSSANTIASKINSFALMPARAISSAIASMVAQNVGAKKPERVKEAFKAGLVISISIGMFFVILTLFFAKEIFSLFTDDIIALSYGVAYITAMCFDYVMLPLAVSMYGMIDGIGNTKVTMAVNIITSLIIRVPLAHFLSITLQMGITGVGISLPLASFISALIIYIYYWKNKDKLYAKIV